MRTEEIVAALQSLFSLFRESLNADPLALYAIYNGINELANKSWGYGLPHLAELNINEYVQSRGYDPEDISLGIVPHDRFLLAIYTEASERLAKSEKLDQLVKKHFPHMPAQAETSLKTLVARQAVLEVLKWYYSNTMLYETLMKYSIL